MKTLRVLGAVAKSARHKLGSFRAIKVNNFFLVIALIVFSGAQSGVEPKAAYAFLEFLLLILLFPLASDPMSAVPASRLALWPLDAGERIALRIASLAMSPILWFIVALLFFRRIRPGTATAFIGLAVAIQVVAALVSLAPRVNVYRLAPRVPGGFGILMRSNMRQMLGSLDVWLALLLAVLSIGYRLAAAHPDPAALPILAILIALCVGNYAQCLFGRDLASSAVTRYRLLPVRGYWVLLAKGAPVLAVTFALTAAVDATVGLTYGFTALAFGHHASMVHAAPLRAWRFSGSRLYIGVAQGVAGIIFAFAAVNRGAMFLSISAALYALSVAIYGVIWLRR